MATLTTQNIKTISQLDQMASGGLTNADKLLVWDDSESKHVEIPVSQLDDRYAANVTAVNAAKEAAETAQGLAETAQSAAETAASSASTSATTASNAAQAASASETSAATNEAKAEGYAVGTENGNPVATTSLYHENNAKWYKEQSDINASSASTNALKAEGYAVGKQNGTAVLSGDYFENNAEYFKRQANSSATSAAQSASDASTNALKAEGWARGTQNNTRAVSGEPYFEDNACYYKGQAEASAAAAAGSAQDASDFADAAADALSQFSSISAVQTTTSQQSAGVNTVTFYDGTGGSIGCIDVRNGSAGRGINCVDVSKCADGYHLGVSYTDAPSSQTDLGVVAPDLGVCYTTEACYQAMVQAGTVDPNTFYYTPGTSCLTADSFQNVCAGDGISLTCGASTMTISAKKTYSTTEQTVGTWIDNKPVYKTVQTFSTSGTLAIIPANIDDIVKISVLVKTSSGDWSEPYYNSATDYWNYRVNGTNLVVSAGADLSIARGLVVIEYTKTTD